MKQEILTHRFAYFVLLSGLVLLTVAFLLATQNPWLQRSIALAIASFYLMWGAATHFKSQRLTKKIVYEYASISLIAGLLLFLITL
ncbi:MAG: hypothetical protein M3Q81_03965 [bacterium]|nr:hypothetical protein [bacterium]